MKNFQPQKIIAEAINTLPGRTKDIMLRRFGLKNESRQTLEEIGRKYGITRERVRQIEVDGLKTILSSSFRESFRPYWRYFEKYLSRYGYLRREDVLLDEIISTVSKSKTDIDIRAAIFMLLSLGDDFNRINRSNTFHTSWSYGDYGYQNASKALSGVTSQLKKQKKTVGFRELTQLFKKAAPSKNKLTPKAVQSYLDATKLIGQNCFGELGLSHWQEISPRGSRDRAYIVMKKEARPLHFTEVAELINKHNLSPRKAYVQTIHNELIKDPRFVLVGRGLYALKEWGHEGGTVGEIIAKIIKRAKKPLAKDAIINAVLAKRYVKANTVALNLQNKNLFKRDSKGFYSLKV